MRKGDKGLLYQDLDRLFQRGAVSSGDGALLDGFLTEGDEAAFEALVNRHGPMVRGVCRRILSNPHDADDAFQATFLVLVRKGGRLRDPDRLGPWLHGVATRVAGKARARASRRTHEAIIDVPAREDGSAERSDVMSIIDAELARMSSRHRDVLVACLVEGATAEEASRRLACPVGTIKSRLARARETLRARLTSRGVAPALALAALETTDAFTFASPVSSTLIRATLKTVTAKAAPGVVALTEGVASTMISKSTFTIVAAVGLSFAGLAAAAWLKPTRAQDQPPQDQPKAEAPAPPEKPKRSPEQVSNYHLRGICLALHNYLSANNAFPAAYSESEKDGKALLSWRVAILPFLGQSDLYQRFHLDEPWDSPNNKPLIDLMPDDFKTPHSPAPRGETRIRGYTGKRGVFERRPTEADGRDRDGAPAEPKGWGITEITDGTSNTILVAVAKQTVTWTEPDGLRLPIVPQDTELDDSDPRGYMVAMCDGAVRWLRKDHPHSLTALITRNGGEVVSDAVFVQPGSPAAPESSVEQRLQRVEEKLDRLLEKLDAK